MLYLVSSTSHTTTILHAIIVIITAIIITQLLLSRLCNFPGLHLDLQRYNSSITRIAIDGSRKRRYRHRGVWFREWGNGWEAYQFIVDTHWPTTRRRLGLSARRQEPCPPVASCLRARNALHDQASSPLRQISPHLSDEEVLLSQTCAHTVRSAFTLIHQRERRRRCASRPATACGGLPCLPLAWASEHRERERGGRLPHASAACTTQHRSAHSPPRAVLPPPRAARSLLAAASQMRERQRFMRAQGRGCPVEGGGQWLRRCPGRLRAQGRGSGGGGEIWIWGAPSTGSAGAGKRERRRRWDLDLGAR
jgi:hypothetical protein